MDGYVTNTGNTGYRNNIFDGKPQRKQTGGGHKQYRRDGVKDDTNYLDPKVSKWARGPTTLHMFLYFSIVQLLVDCTN